MIHVVPGEKNGGKEVHLCNCKDSCPAHPKDRLMHIGDECHHIDGSHHKIRTQHNSG